MPLTPEVHHVEQVGVAMFPEGLQALGELELRWRLFDSQHVLLEDSAVSLVGHAEITPAFPRAYLALRLAPVAFWDVTARVVGTYYFGLFSALIPVDDPDYAATREHQRAREGDRVPGWGLRLDVDTRLKAKVGPFIVVAELEARHHDIVTADGVPPYVWEPTDMILVPGSGWVWYRYLYLLGEFVPAVGPGGAYLWAGLYGVWETAPGTADENVRLGPLVMVKPAPRWPLFYLGVQPWQVSRFHDQLPPYSFVAAQWSR